MLHSDDVDPKRVEAIADEFFAEKGVPGLAYGVVVDGVLVHGGGRGRRRVTVHDAPAGETVDDEAEDDESVDDASAPDPDTVFRIASMTKSFTAAAVVALRDDGLLSLDDPVAAWVPEVAQMGLATRDSAPITIRQLLTMSGGLPTDDPWGDRQQALPEGDFAALVAGGLRWAWPNGTAFEYSNLGFALLGRVISAVSGVEYREAVTSRVLAPLGLTSTVYAAQDAPADRLAHGYRSLDGRWEELPFEPYGAFAPMGGLFSTVRDLSRWVGGFTDAFPARDDPERALGAGGHPLRRASRREMQQPHRGLPPQLTWTSVDTAPQLRATAYGFGLFVEQDPQLGVVVGHSGGYPGFGSNMRWHPDSGIGVIVLGNSTYAQAPRVGARMLAALLDGLPTADVARARSGSSSAVPPRSGALWPETVAAQAAVESLVHGWDDAVADRLLATNVDQDDALPRRRAHLDTLRSELGPFARDDDGEQVSDSPAHLTWWMRGPGGRLKVEIRLTPQLPPRVQTLSFTGIPNPPAELRALADLVVATLAADDPRWPDEVPVGDGLTSAALTALLRVAAGWAGRSRIAEVIGGNGTSEATFRLDGARAPLLLSLTRDPTSRAVTQCTLRPPPP